MGLIGVVDVVARELLLFAAAGILIGGIDDLAIDALFLVRLLVRGDAGPRRLVDLPAVAPVRIAIVVAAWQEEGVIGAMLSAALARYRYPDFHIFAAAYPNDPATVDAIARIAERDDRLRLVINPRPGPTTKADNLNAAWAAVDREERASGRPFAAVVIHDAEDVVHPDELTLCARLLLSVGVDF